MQNPFYGRSAVATMEGVQRLAQSDLRAPRSEMTSSSEFNFWARTACRFTGPRLEILGRGRSKALRAAGFDPDEHKEAWDDMLALNASILFL
jgi:hypothetical protein